MATDPSLPLQEESLMMPPPVPNRSVKKDLLSRNQREELEVNFLLYPGPVLP